MSSENSTVFAYSVTQFDEKPIRDHSIGELLENRAAKIPHDVFLRYGPDDEEYTFQDVNDVSNRIANSLVERDLVDDGTAALFMRVPINNIYILFALWKCGVVSSPINHDYQGDLLSYQINDLQPSLLFVDSDGVSKIHDVRDDLDKLPVLVTTDELTGERADGFDTISLETLLQGNRDPVECDVHWGDQSNIIYTSGTTGQPKGVIARHRSILSSAGSRYFMFDSDDVFHIPLPFYHIAAINNMLCTLIVGGTSAIWDKFSTNNFWDRVQKYNATSTTLMSVMVDWLAASSPDDVDHRNPLYKVHMAPLPDNYEELASQFGFDIVTVGYGSTECGQTTFGIVLGNETPKTPPNKQRGVSVEAIVNRARNHGVACGKEAPGENYIGKPFSHRVNVDIVDDYDEEVSEGVVGELVVRPSYAGAIMKGYHEKPQATLSSFDNLWFHTGDAVKKDAMGNYYFVDRMDNVLRKRGENISSIQLEGIINRFPEVAACAAFPHPSDESEDKIGIAVVLENDVRFEPQELRKYVGREAPSYMIPDFIYVVDELPKTDSNKIKKQELMDELYL